MTSSNAVPHPLPEPLAELLAQRFRVLSEPMRIRLLDRLRDGAATVQELQLATGASQQNVSKHLGLMLREGVVTRSKDGNYARYSIADEAIFGLCEMVCGTLRQQLAELESILEGAA